MDVKGMRYAQKAREFDLNVPIREELIMSVATTKGLLTVCIVLIFLFLGCNSTDITEWYRADNLFNAIAYETDEEDKETKTKKKTKTKKETKTAGGRFVINLDEYVLRRDRAAGMKIPALDRVMGSDVPPEKSPILRHELLDELMEISNAIFERHVIEIKMSEDVREFVVDSLVTVGTGIVPLFGGNRVKSILSGSTSMLTGVNAHIHNRVYNAYVALAIIKAMREKRKELAHEIEKKRTATIAEYPLSRGLRDIQEYHRFGSFVRGVELLSEGKLNVSNEEPKRKEEPKSKENGEQPRARESIENTHAQAPTEVRDFKFVLSDTDSIILSWTNPTDGNFKGLLISRWDDQINAVEKYLNNYQGNNYQGNNKATAPYMPNIDYVAESKNMGEKESYESKGLKSGKEYLYAAWAFDGSNNYSKPVVLRVRK